MKCKECKKETVTEVKRAEISIRYPKKAIEIVANNICMKCFLRAVKAG